MRRRLLAVLPVGLLVLSVAPGVVTADATTGVGPWPADVNAWHRYVESPATRDLGPVHVVSVSGDVSNPQALIHPTPGASATLTMQPGGSAPTVVLDYGLEIGGYPSFDVAAASGAPVLHVSYSEALANLTTTGDVWPTPLLFQSADPLRNNDYPVATPGAITSTYIQGGERYQMLTLLTPGSVSLSAVRIHQVGFLGTADALRGHFLSSDDLLNRIWYAGVYTVNLNQVLPGTAGGQVPGDVNNSTLVIDGAKRDRAVWSGDLAIAGPTVYYALDPAYARGSLQLIGDHPGTLASIGAPAVGVASAPGPMGGVCPPFTSAGSRCFGYSATYSMVFSPDMYGYFLHTGDLAFVRQEWPLITRQMAWDAQQVDSSGLFATDAADGFDWNVSTHPGDLTYVNAMYVLALKDAAALGDAVGDAANASAYRDAARRITDAVNAQLWNPSMGAYDASTTSRGTVIQDANVFAVLAGIAPLERRGQVLDAVTRTLSSRFGILNVPTPAPSGYTQIISPYMGGFELTAAFESGRTDAALAQIRKEWGWMVTHDPGGLDWEKIGVDGSIPSAASAAHAWATAPTPALSRYVLGISPTAAGFTAFDVMPHPGDVAWAEGSVPTPQGSIAVRWAQQDCGGFVLEADVPASTTATLAVPIAAATATVTADGRQVWSAARGATGASRVGAGYASVPTATAGHHVVTASGACAGAAAAVTTSGTPNTGTGGPGSMLVLASTIALCVGVRRRRRCGTHA